MLLQDSDVFVQTLDMFDGFKMRQAFNLYMMGKKQEYRFDHFPPFLLADGQNAPERAKQVARGVQFFLDYLNRLTDDFSRLSEYDSAVRKLASYLEFLRPHGLNSMLYDAFRSYLQHLSLSHAQTQELQDCFKYYLYLPVLEAQAKRKQLVTGHHSQSDKYIWNRIAMLYPRQKLLPKLSFAASTPPHLLTEETVILSSPRYFVFPLFHISELFTEKDQDMLPTLWSHTYLFEMRDIPDIGEHWRDLFQQAKREKRYTVSPSGVLVDCAGLGDLRSITLKEVRIFGDLCLYAKPAFSDGSEDVVLVSLDHDAILASGYGDIYGYEQDRVLHIVAKCYSELVSSTEIHYANSKDRSKLALATGPARTRFTYLPRATCEGEPLAAIRQPEGNS